MRIVVSILLILIGSSITAQFKEVNIAQEQNYKPNQIELDIPAHKKWATPTTQTNELGQLLTPKKLDWTRLEGATVLKTKNDIPSKIQFDQIYNASSRANFEEVERKLLSIVHKTVGKDDQNMDIGSAIELVQTETELHKKYQQYYKGIKIYYSDVRLHFVDREPIFMTGDLFRMDGDIEVNPLINKSDAEAIMKNAFAPIHPLSDKVKKHLPFVLQTELVIYHTETSEQQPILAYVMHFYPDALHQWVIVIDANDGHIVKKFLSSCSLHNHDHDDEKIRKSEKSMPPDGPITAVAVDLLGQSQSLNIYEENNQFYFLDASRSMYDENMSMMPNNPVGVIWTLDAFDSSPQRDDFNYDHVSNNSNNWSGREEAVSAHANAGKAYEYFKNIHGRSSINGSGGNIVSFVNVTDDNDLSMGNAFWNGAAMWYGNGDSAFRPLARSLDVAGHELTHGVVQSTANLEYYGESGALNESFADIFGAMIDGGDWQIGEDVVRSEVFPSGALRDMQDPHNGASFQDYGRGWQPKHVDEQFTGAEDNNGVHINSGIPNHAYYQLATTIGSTKAEQIYYRALTLYMTKSSKFVDQRNAVEQAAQDLYGTEEIQAVQNAFSAVGIGAGSGVDYEQEVVANPGQDYIVFTTDDRNGLYLYDLSNVTQISTSEPISKPSVSDDGSEIVFIASDKKMHYITIDWSTGDVNESILQSDPIWRNVVISKDGVRIAAVFAELDNTIWMYDFSIMASNTYELYNPTFTEGVSTGDVLYADALEFDFSGEYLMYDANNKLSGSSADIEYWDVGFIKVWNNESGIWSLGDIQKLFTALPEGVSIGNPTFSKNSPFIVAFDYLDSDDNYQLLSSNIEQGSVGSIYNNSGLSYPSFSRIDDKIIFDAPYAFNGTTGIDIGVIDVQEDKIMSVANSEVLFRENARWGVWFSNGSRDLISKVLELDENDDFDVFPTITSDIVHIRSADQHIDRLELFDMNGAKQLEQDISGQNGQLDLSSYASGMYLIVLYSDASIYSKKVMKL